MMEKNLNLKRYVALGFATFLLLNIIFCALLIFYPTVSQRNKLTKAYKLHLLPGPFFRDRTIKSIATFAVRFKKDEVWGQWIFPERRNFMKYHEDYSRFDKLKQGVFERELVRRLAVRFTKNPALNYTNVKEFKQLSHYLKEEYAPKDADSTSFLYTIKWVRLVGVQVHIDTVFSIQYKTR